MKSYIFFALLIWASYNPVTAQLRGIVRGISSTDTLNLNGAKLKLLVAKKAVFSNSEGHFELYLGKKFPDTLVASYAGFFSDTLVLTSQDRFAAISMVLFSDDLRPEVLVERKAKNGILKISITQIERISSKELARAACCNLSESFETNASVDVNITDAVSGARRIQLLGLDGVYTQFQLENIPFLRGLESVNGLQSFSGIWLDGIQISKGTGSVVNGHESMAGLINLSTKNPFNADKLLFNAYGNRFGRMEANAIYGHTLSERWATSLLLNGAYNKSKIDENRDGFLDLPQSSTGAVFNRWQFQGERMEAQIGVYVYSDDRISGQFNDTMAQLPYQMNLNNKHFETFLKTGFFGKKPGESLGLIQSFKWHETGGAFGVNSIGGQRSIEGSEQRYFASLIYDNESKDGVHKLKSGVSFNYLDMAQRAGIDVLNRIELNEGLFSEYSLILNRLSMQLGARLDYNSLFGLNFVPRAHLKFALTPKLDLRLTAGKGWRTPNVLIENTSLLANNKSWILPSNLLPEISWNVGGSLVKEGEIFSQKFSWTNDLYYTWFQRQLNVDRDVSMTEIVFNYIENQAYALAFQSEADLQIGKLWSLRCAYKYLQVESIYQGQMQQQVMVPKHRILATVSFTSKNKRWQGDLTSNFVGTMRMPYQMANSPVYPYVFGQVSHQWKRLKVYLGVENILNVKQPNPIISASNPFDPSFDASMVWGPITGTNVYAGFTFLIKQKKK